ncbi:MAG: peptidylprolyl isomerase [Phycisphaerae bacterium]|nr:peptidylprolyl isomerase [Phycisphaerae bacterium]
MHRVGIRRTRAAAPSALLVVVAWVGAVIAQPPRDLAGVERAEQAARDAGPGREGDRPALVVNGEAIDWADLRGALAEGAGRRIVEEVVLDRLLSAEMDRRGLTLTQDALDAEGRLLVESLDQSSDPSGRDELLRRVRRARGLGPERLNALVVRSARLRALVGDAFSVSREEVELGAALRFGPASRCRVLAVPTDRDAARIRAALIERAGGEGRPIDPVAFSLEAIRASTHPSGNVGGLVARLSPHDPAYPIAIRQAAESLAPGGLSPVVLIDDGAALIMVEERLPERGRPDEGDLARIERELGEGKQRSAMDALANRLLDEARVTVLDASLRWAWEAR